MSLKNLARRVAAVVLRRDRDAIGRYVQSAPNPQNVVDIFKGEWSSQFPAETGVEAGRLPLFEDSRVQWFLEASGGVEGQRVLELGPLEAAHTVMLEKAGASEVIAVEANTRAFLRCLAVKEIFQLQRSRFLCGDFLCYLEDLTDDFDTTVACGVLYHMSDPVRLLELVCRRTRRQIMLWTHYFDAEVVGRNPELAAHLKGAPVRVEHAGFEYTAHPYEYQGALNWSGFCGAGAHGCRWMERQDILDALTHFGFGEIEVSEDWTDHPHGPHFLLRAQRA